MLYAYAVIGAVIDASGQPLPAVAGLERQTLEAAARGGVAVVYTRHPASRIAPTPEHVWQHESVVEALMARGPVLPARFGTTFANEQSLADALSLHATSLTAGLERIRGSVELGVSVLWRPPLTTTPLVPGPGSRDGSAGVAASVVTSGRDYMSARLAEEKRRRDREERAAELCDLIHAALLPEAREGTRRTLPTPEFLMTAAYLVGADRIDPFRVRVSQVSAEHPTLRLLCTGPWPPYHFAPALAPAVAPVFASVPAPMVTPAEAQNV